MHDCTRSLNGIDRLAANIVTNGTGRLPKQTDDVLSAAIISTFKRRLDTWMDDNSGILGMDAIKS